MQGRFRPHKRRAFCRLGKGEQIRQYARSDTQQHSNVLYAVVALAGGLLLLSGVPNVSVSGLAISISVIVPFLNMTKQFAGNVGQVSHQINAVVMGLAGAQRIFRLIDQQPEPDDGYVTLVNAKEVDDSLSNAPSARGYGHGSIRTATARSRTPGLRAMFVLPTWILNTSPESPCSTT